MKAFLILAGLMFTTVAMADTQVRVEVTTRAQEYHTCAMPGEYTVCPSAGMWRYTLLDVHGNQYKFSFSAAQTHAATFTLPDGFYTAIVDRLTTDGKRLGNSAVMFITVNAGAVTFGYP